METVIQTVGNKKSLMRSQEDNLLLEEYKRRLIEIVKHHELVFKYIEQQKIALKTKLKKKSYFSRYSDNVNKCFTWILSIQYICSTFLICVMLIQLSATKIWSISFLSIISYGFLVVFQIFINCYNGNEIKIQSEEILFAAYSSKWNELGRNSYKVKNYILIIMCRSLYPNIITIGKFAVLDLPTFVVLAKASYTYFTFLGQVNEM